ncbi:MAG TPA: class I SAM-dependent methyltransferase [Dongiaceae bacterium]|nr:class I SAM-dependent methyltransferase [Dongiaceae bacterium]
MRASTGPIDRGATTNAADRAARARLSAATIAHYESAAQSYEEHTLDHDVSQNIAALLGAVEGPPPWTILDFGCGPGRDLRQFRSLGHEAVGVDGCAAFVARARAMTECEVLHQDFLALDLPAERFDGVFANASLFHVPRAELPRVLGELRAALRPRGVLFASNPRGGNEEGWSGDRYCCFHDLKAWRRFLGAAGFVQLDHYYRPAGRPRRDQPWLATLWRRA